VPVISGAPYSSQHQGVWGAGAGIKYVLTTNAAGANVPQTATGLTFGWADLLGYVSRYALGRDYHRVLRQRLAPRLCLKKRPRNRHADH
jgi:hypothetical protein